MNKDGEVSGEEILKVLNTVSSIGTSLTKYQLNASVDQVIKKLAEGADNFSSMKDYSRHLIKKFDRDDDGIITF